MSEPDEKAERWSWPFKVWLVVFFVIYLGAKVHTYLTFDSPVWLERHWLFWAASLAWVGVGGLVNWLARRFPRKPSASE